jgi:hypothetical protein
LLEGLNGFVFIYQRVAAVIVPDEIGYNASDCIRPFSVKSKEVNQERTFVRAQKGLEP